MPRNRAAPAGARRRRGALRLEFDRGSRFRCLVAFAGTALAGWAVSLGVFSWITHVRYPDLLYASVGQLSAPMESLGRGLDKGNLGWLTVVSVSVTLAGVILPVASLAEPRSRKLLVAACCAILAYLAWGALLVLMMLFYSE